MRSPEYQQQRIEKWRVRVCTFMPAARIHTGARQRSRPTAILHVRMPCHRWQSVVSNWRLASVQEHYYSPEQVARREQATAAQAETQQAARQPNSKAARQRAIARRREVNHVRMLGARLAQARQLIPMAEAALQQLLSQVERALHQGACTEVHRCFVCQLSQRRPCSITSSSDT